MTFEDTIKKISTTLASVVLFLIAFGIYMSAKGFSIDEDGNLTLRKSAEAGILIKEVEAKDINGNLINTEINLDEVKILGKADAPVTIYEYSSFGCSHCADFHLYTLPQIKKEYIESGKVKLIFVDFPLEKKSMQAALLSHCVAGDGYYDFLNILFKNQREWNLSFKTDKILSDYASLFGISNKKAAECMKNNDLQNKILNNRNQAIETFKIQGTPSFVIEHNDKKEVIHGAPGYNDFKEVIDKALAKK